jgi:hypothetical protein
MTQIEFSEFCDDKRMKIEEKQIMKNLPTELMEM